MKGEQPIINGQPAVGRTLLFYAQDNRGLGHINRTLTIARRVLAAHPDAIAYIATKSSIPANFTLPERCDYIKLPTRLTPDGLQQTEHELEAAKQRFRTIRGQLDRKSTTSELQSHSFISY